MKLALSLLALWASSLFVQPLLAQTAPDARSSAISLTVPPGAPLRLYLTKRVSKRIDARTVKKLVEYRSAIGLLASSSVCSLMATACLLRSEDIEGTNKMKVTARITGLGRQDEALEQLVMRLSLEAGVSSVSWAVHTEVPE